MIQIKLNNEQVLEAIQANGATRFYQNANRDTLEFVFSSENSMDTLAQLFSNKDFTRKLTIIQNGSEYIYNDYVLQVSVSRENVVVQVETSDAPEVTETRIKVTMAQQTYTEKLIEQLLGNK